MANEVLIVIKAKDKASGVISGVQSKTKGLGRTVLGMAGGFIAAQASIAAVKSIMTKSIGAAMKYEAQMAEIRALTGATKKDTDFLTVAIKGMVRSMPKSPAELGAAAYFILSSGIEDVADASKVLEVAAKASTIGLGETKDIANALTTVLNAYGMSAERAGYVTDIMIEAVKQGKAEASEFASVLGRVVPLAAQMGISFEEVAANLATFTRLGVSAEEAATGLRQVMASLLKPTQQQEEAMADLGFSAEGLRKSIREKGLLATLDDMLKATGGNEAAVAKLFPNIRALTSVLGTAGVQMDGYTDILAAMGISTGNLEEGFAIVSDTAEFKLTVAIGNLNLVLMELGTEVLPVVAVAAMAATDALLTTKDAIGEVITVAKAAEGGLSLVGLGLDDIVGRIPGVKQLKTTLDLGDVVLSGVRALGLFGWASDSAAYSSEAATEELRRFNLIASQLEAQADGTATAVDDLSLSIESLTGRNKENIATIDALAGVYTQEQLALDLQINTLQQAENAAKQAEVGQSDLGGATESTTDAISRQVGALENLALSMVPQALNDEIIALDRELKVLRLGKLEIDAQVNARKRLAQAQLAMANIANLPGLAKQKGLELARAKILAKVGGNTDKLTKAQKKQVESIEAQITALQSSINVRTLEAELTNIQAEASEKNRESMQSELNVFIDQIGITEDLKRQRELYIDTLVPIELLQEIDELGRQATALANSEKGAQKVGGAQKSLSGIIGDTISKLDLERNKIDLVTEGWRLQGLMMLDLPVMEDVRVGFEQMKKLILLQLSGQLATAMGEMDLPQVFEVSRRIAEVTNIKFAAQGFHGQVTKPTLFMAGEAGSERVDITPGGGRGGGGGLTVNVYVEGSIMSEEELTGVIADTIRGGGFRGLVDV